MRILPILLLLSTSALAQSTPATPETPDQGVRLQDCTREGKDVICTLLFKSTATKALNLNLAPYNFTIQTPNGQTFKVSELQFSNEKWRNAMRVITKPGLEYSGKFRIADVPDSTIKLLKINLGGSYFTAQDIPVRQPQTAVSYPGQPRMRQQTRVTDTFYTAVLHGCYSTGNSKASCLVTLLPDKPAGSRKLNVTEYAGGTLQQIDGLDVVDGKVSVPVGSVEFKDVAVN